MGLRWDKKKGRDRNGSPLDRTRLEERRDAVGGPDSAVIRRRRPGGLAPRALKTVMAIQIPRIVTTRLC